MGVNLKLFVFTPLILTHFRIYQRKKFKIRPRWRQYYMMSEVMIWYDWLNYLNPLPEKEIEEPSQTRGNMIWGVWWWVEGWKGNMEEGFLGRLSRRRMAGPIYIIILLLSPGDAKIDDADVEQVVVELNQWKWLWRLWQNSRVSIFWQPAVIIVLSAYPRIDEAKSLLAFIV